MLVKEVAEKLGLKILAAGNDQEVTGGYVSDLLSDVIANAEEGLPVDHRAAAPEHRRRRPAEKAGRRSSSAAAASPMPPCWPGPGRKGFSSLPAAKIPSPLPARLYALISPSK